MMHGQKKTSNTE